MKIRNKKVLKLINFLQYVVIYGSCMLNTKVFNPSNFFYTPNMNLSVNDSSANRTLNDTEHYSYEKKNSVVTLIGVAGVMITF